MHPKLWDPQTRTPQFVETPTSEISGMATLSPSSVLAPAFLLAQLRHSARLLLTNSYLDREGHAQLVFVCMYNLIS